MMYKKLITIGISFGTLLIADFTHAQSPSKPLSNETEKQNNLSRTEQRLEDLIKAAAAQNLLEIRGSEQSTPTARSTTIPAMAVEPTDTSCRTKELFSFSRETHAKQYDDILTLKKSMVTGPGQVDRYQAQILAQAYLGLGFADEAINIAGHLQATEQSVIIAMAKLAHGTINDTHRKTIKSSADCFEAAQIWHKLAQPGYVGLTDVEFDYLKKLPERLGEILGLQLAMKAVQNKDLKSAQLIYEYIRANAENRESYDPTISPYLQNDADTLVGALLALEKNEENDQGRAIYLLKSIAERDGPYRAQALQALINADHFYPEYIQDLDSITQTFSETPSGKQAQAQKINFLAQNKQFTNAVTLTKDSFEVGSGYYNQSVAAISNEMISALSSNEANLQLGALNTLIAEGAFFAHLTRDKPLLYAGVKACAELGLPELSPKVLSVHLWGGLEDSTLTLLALHDARPEHFRFPKRIFETPALQAVELRKAFDNKSPKQALAIRNKNPNVVTLQRAFTQAAWNNGYWSLARNGLREITNGQAPNNFHLASSLSVISPLLINTNQPDGLAEQQALQSYLDGDLKIIRSYLLSKFETTPQTITGARNG